MAALTRKYFEARLVELVSDKRAHVAEVEKLTQKQIAHEAQINAIMGAIQEVQSLLDSLDADEAPPLEGV